MRAWKVFGFVLFLFVSLFTTVVFAEPEIEVAKADTTANADIYSHLPYSYASAVEIAAPSVVNVYSIRTVRDAPHDGDFNHYWKRSANEDDSAIPAQVERHSSLGSGVIIDKRGYILTNYHVVKNANSISVALLDGRRIRAKLIGTDADTDLAVLRIELNNLKQITVGDSDDIRVGDIVLAIGNPFGLGQTVTQGIVSAIGRNTIGINQLENYIQTDAAINPGNSGGALVNTRGQLIGINTGIYSRSGGYQGVGFAIPASAALNVLNQVVKYGYVKRGWIGANVSTLNPRVSELLKLNLSAGVVITGVTPNSPAAKANLQRADVVTFVDKTRVSSVRGFLNYIAQRKPADVIKLTLFRQGKEIVVPVTVEVRPAPAAGDDRGAAPNNEEMHPDDTPAPKGGKNYIPDER